METVLNPRGVVEADGTLGAFCGASSTQVFTWYGWAFGALKGWSFGAGHFKDNGERVGGENYTIRYTMCPAGVDYNTYSFATDYSLDVYGSGTTATTKYTPHVLTHTTTMDETATTTETDGVPTTVYTGKLVTYQNGTHAGAIDVVEAIADSWPAISPKI